MRYPQRFWPFVLVVGFLYWGVLAATFNALLTRVLDGAWPEVDAGYVVGWIVGSFFFGSLLWWWQKRSGRELR